MQRQCTDDFRGPIKPLGCDLNAEAPEESQRGQTAVKNVSHLLHLISLLLTSAHLITVECLFSFFYIYIYFFFFQIFWDFWILETYRWLFQSSLARLFHLPSQRCWYFIYSKYWLTWGGGTELPVVVICSRQCLCIDWRHLQQSELTTCS